MIRRREFITLLGGAAAAWPLAARAQQEGRVRRVGMLIGWSENDPEYRSQIAGFVQALAQLGWADGRNIRVDARWTNGEVDRARTFAKELAELRPDVILATTTPATAAMQRETSTIPIVFAVVSDPVGAGFVVNLPRPGGNITGFTNTEAGMGGKWLELLKEVTPRLSRVAIMFNPDTAAGGGSYYMDSFQAAAKSLAVEPSTARVHSDSEIEAAIALLAREQAGLVVMSDSFMAVHRGTVISLATRSKVPTTFDQSYFPREGGLISYGIETTDLFLRAAAYVDRIFKGEMPGDLPVQLPTKFKLVINLKTAKAIGLTVPESFLLRADEVIE
jgi:putative tryptophan/tyrosine transport system substrate-binding protein